MTEAEFFSMQATQAKAGMSRAIALGKDNAKQAANPKNIAKAQPFAAVGAAAIAGMAAAWVVVPSKDRGNKSVESTGRRRRSSGSLKKKLLRLGIGYAKPIVISTITGALGGAIGGKKAGEAAADDAADASTAGHAPTEHPYADPL